MASAYFGIRIFYRLTSKKCLWLFFHSVLNEQSQVTYLLQLHIFISIALTALVYLKCSDVNVVKVDVFTYLYLPRRTQLCHFDRVVKFIRLNMHNY